MDRKILQIYKEYIDGEFDYWWLNKEVDEGITVTRIEYHEPRGEGDAHYCDVYMNNGKMRRVFRPDNIDFEEV